jgi:hypothetical protein
MTEEQLTALLRIKRFEQPPPRYFDQLLKDLHHRQRVELLRRPLWKIATERLQTFFSEHSMGHLSYAGALASVLVIGVVGIGLMTSGGNPAVAPVGAKQFAANHAAPKASAENSRLLSLDTSGVRSRHVLDMPSLPAVSRAGYSTLARAPRYIIDTQPASYEPSSIVNF